jgi:hypothetical protein
MLGGVFQRFAAERVVQIAHMLRDEGLLPRNTVAWS